MIELKDQMNYTIRLEKFPERIVSLVPSQTELLSYFGCDEEVVAITKFCIHPIEWYQSKLKVGGTKKVNINEIISLKPDLIIGNKEENTLADISALKEIAPVYMSDIFTKDDAFKMITDLAIILNKKERAQTLINEINHSFSILKAQNKKVLYLIWQEPYMAAGRNTFIGNMIENAGFENSLVEATLRYPELSEEEIKNLNPDIIFLSTEPFPFKEKHAKDLEKKLTVKTKLVDGEMFSWYGSRMLLFPNYIQNNLIL